jgi:hypothetical protein
VVRNRGSCHLCFHCRRCYHYLGCCHCRRGQIHDQMPALIVFPLPSLLLLPLLQWLSEESANKIKELYLLLIANACIVAHCGTSMYNLRSLGSSYKQLALSYPLNVTIQFINNVWEGTKQFDFAAR